MSSVIRYAYLFDEVEVIEKTTPILTPRTTKKPPKNHLKTTQKPHKNHTKTTSKTTSKWASEILKNIENSPNIAINKLSEILGLKYETTRWNVRNLQKKGVIRRVGSNRGGYWEIIQNNKE